MDVRGEDVGADQLVVGGDGGRWRGVDGMKNLTKEEFVHILHLQINGFARGSSRYRGVTLHKCGRWKARMGQFLGKKYEGVTLHKCGRWKARMGQFLGIESFSKLGDYIYFEETESIPGLYIIQFIPTTGTEISCSYDVYLIRKREMTSDFDSLTLADKLNKLDSTQKSIQSLSTWCISHRKKAKQVVETWEKLFNSSSKEQRVSFLYLANDILQNSRRKGSEFVNEFWKVLPGVLKNVYENSEDLGKNVVMRLVGIWEERKVFGSRGQGLKSDILGKETGLTTLLDSNGKSSKSNAIKLVKRDTQTIRLKLAVGGMPEKIVTAYQSVLDEHFNEDTTLNKCKAAINLVERIAKDIDVSSMQGNLQGSPLINKLQEQENILKQCIDQLRSAEATRASLITYLKEGLEEQESKLEHVRAQMQVRTTYSLSYYDFHL
ncbi:uncharacterized protein A4U43_C08F32400 [Asparagus officinalis]|nr:uncharacterized protein A4U43_C08F32400 [Asparagus officinalis]